MLRTLGRKLVKNLNDLAKKYNFDYGFVNDFGEELNYDINLLSKVSVLGTDPNEILEGCKTVIVFAFKHDNFSNSSNIASFSWGEDYHKKLEKIGEEISSEFNDAVFLVDTHSLNERYFANKSGIGFIGKNSMFISDKYGSFCHLALLLTTEELVGSRTSLKQCGACTRCIEVCPVNAIGDQIDCNKCISEKLQKRDNLDFTNIGTSVYGCDECQIVCPHNKIDKKETMLYNGVNIEENLYLNKKDFSNFSNRTFYWIGYRSFIRNIHVAYVNKTNDYSKLEFLKNSNSEYLRNVALKLEGVY